MKKFPKVTIVFPNFNGGKEPLECLGSINKLNYPKDKIETIVVDNGSSDGSDIKIKKKFPKVQLIKNEKNVGFASAINQGIAKAKGTYIFVANDDLIFEKNSLKILAEYALARNNTGVLGGKIFYKNQPKKISSAGFSINKWTGNIKVSPNPHKIKEPDWVQGCAMLIPKRVFNLIGLFDESFTHLFEDFDLCLRIRKAGLKVVYIPSAKFWHGDSLTANKNKALKYYHWYQGKFRFLLKNLPALNVLSIFLIQIFLVSPYRALILQDGRLKPFLKALYWNLKNLPKTIAVRRKTHEARLS